MNRARIRRAGSSFSGDLDTTGSVWSRSAPDGGVAPIAVWDFCDATTIANANVTGDSIYDLSAAGSPVFPGAPTNRTGPAPFSGFPTARVKGCGNVLCWGVGNYVRINPAPAALKVTGAMTVEILLRFVSLPAYSSGPSYSDCIMVGGPGIGASGDNRQWDLLYSASNNELGYYAENGAGVSNYFSGFNIDNQVGTAQALMAAPMLIGITRNSSNQIGFYVNGRLVKAVGNPSANNVPDGGANNIFAIGFTKQTTSPAQVTYGARFFNRTLTAAAMLESAARTLYGVSST